MSTAPEPAPGGDDETRPGAAAPDRDGSAAGSSHRDDPSHAQDATDSDDEATQPANEERGRQQNEFRIATASALDWLSSFGLPSSGVTIVAGKASFKGPVAGGDIGGGGGRGAGAVLSHVSARTVSEISRVHVAPGNLTELSTVVERDAVLLLRARKRWGATTTAIHLVSSLKTVYELRFGGALATLPVEDLPKGSGFVLEQITAGQLAELRDRDLPSLQERFGKRHSRLVAIIDATARVPDHAVGRRALLLQSPPAALDLVRSHLAELLGSSPRAAEFARDNDLAAVLADLDADSFDARQLVEFACDLAAAANGRSTMAEAVERFADRSRQDVGAWLDEVTDYDQRSMIVSLAVLNDMPYDAVSRAARMLEQGWRDDDAGGGTTQPRARRSRTTRLQAARARITHEVRRARYGSAELEVASFVDGSYPSRVLHHLWHEQDYDRDIVLDWLKAVARDVEGRVRIRAASAIGFLAQYAFDTIRREVIQPWAGSGHGDERERAVAALALPARHPETATATVRLVLDWAERRSQPLRLSAARALGFSVGATLPDGPDEHLATLAEKAEPQLSIAIADSIAGLLVGADPERQLALLRLLDAWSAESRSGRQIAGVWGFLEVALSLWTAVPTMDGEDVYWPTLLWLAAGADPRAEDLTVGPQADPAILASMREVIVRCWGRAMVAPRADLAVQRVLRRWAEAAEQAPLLRPALVSLLLDVADGRRLATLVTFHANTWRDRRALAPDLARNLLDALSRSGGQR